MMTPEHIKNRIERFLLMAEHKAAKDAADAKRTVKRAALVQALADVERLSKEIEE